MRSLIDRIRTADAATVERAFLLLALTWVAIHALIVAARIVEAWAK